ENIEEHLVKPGRRLGNDIGHVRLEIAVIGGGEQQPRVVVKEHDAQVMNRPKLAFVIARVCLRSCQPLAKYFGAAGLDGRNECELTDLANAFAWTVRFASDNLLAVLNLQCEFGWDG